MSSTDSRRAGDALRPSDAGRSAASDYRWPRLASASPGWESTRPSVRSRSAQAADQFDAEAKFVSASKSCSIHQHPQFRAVTTVRGDPPALEGSDASYPGPVLRLIPQKAIDQFDRTLQTYQRARLGRFQTSTPPTPSSGRRRGIGWDGCSIHPTTPFRSGTSSR